MSIVSIDPPIYLPTNFDKTQNVRRKKSNCYKTLVNKLKRDKTQIVTKLKVLQNSKMVTNSNCDKIKIMAKVKL